MSSTPKVKSIHVIFYPPALVLDLLVDGQVKTKQINLPPITPLTDISALAHRITIENSEFKPSHAGKLKVILSEILDKQLINYSDFKLQHIHQTHVMPITECQFNKMGEKFLTSSYDRTARVWDTESGECLVTFSGHTNAVYSCCFNLPYGNLVGTASFDQTAGIWNVADGTNSHILKGHSKEVITVKFDPTSKHLATGSMDCTARLWNVDTGVVEHVFADHTAEHITVEFQTKDPLLLT